MSLDEWLCRWMDSYIYIYIYNLSLLHLHYMLRPVQRSYSGVSVQSFTYGRKIEEIFVG
jgi:hypothetical protein